jgi:hypothetical protein
MTRTGIGTFFVPKKGAWEMIGTILAKVRRKRERTVAG